MVFKKGPPRPFFSRKSTRAFKTFLFSALLKLLPSPSRRSLFTIVLATSAIRYSYLICDHATLSTPFLYNFFILGLVQCSGIFFSDRMFVLSYRVPEAKSDIFEFCCMGLFSQLFIFYSEENKFERHLLVLKVCM